MFKKITSMMMALVLCLALCIPAFAMETDYGTEVYNLGDGITITICVEHGDEVMPLAESYGFAWATPYGSQAYNLRPSAGTEFEAHVWNRAEDSNARLSVDYTVEIRGDEVELPTKTLAVNDVAYITISDNKGTGLDGYVNASVKAIDSSSVYYQYHFNQHW